MKVNLFGGRTSDIILSRSILFGNINMKEEIKK